jgi:hypothetical protein
MNPFTQEEISKLFTEFGLLAGLVIAGVCSREEVNEIWVRINNERDNRDEILQSLLENQPSRFYEEALRLTQPIKKEE